MLLRIIRGFVLFCILSVLCVPAQAQQLSMGTLVDFTGSVLVCSRGDWGAMPYQGMTVYDGDKLLTQDGTAFIQFEDKSTLALCANTYVFLEQWPQPDAPFRKNAFNRRITVMFGKTHFKIIDEKLKVRTTFSTRSLVFGIVGDPINDIVQANLSTDGELNNYLLFHIGHKDFTIGPYYRGVAHDIPITTVESMELYAAAREAAQAALEAREAADAFAEGLISEVDKDAIFARAKLKSAEEELAMAQQMVEYHPDKDMVVPQAQAKLEKAQAKYLAAEKDLEAAKLAGASTTGTESLWSSGESEGESGNYKGPYAEQPSDEVEVVSPELPGGEFLPGQ
ncbi:MAG: hypothetical protein JRI97_06970 [Deltaproteobacteria bacterium]|nr:hypothetical protein [Deltaproteobacteria bacterium]